MKKTLTFGLAAAALIAIALSVPSADAKNKAEWKAQRMEHRIERLKSELDLTADQEAKIRAVFETQKEKMKALREETQKKVAAVLTAEQKAKFESLEKHKEKKARDR